MLEPQPRAKLQRKAGPDGACDDRDDRNQVARLGAVDVLLREGSAALPEVQAQQVGLADAEDELDPLRFDECRRRLTQLAEDVAAAQPGRHHPALADRHRFGRELVQEGRELVVVDQALGEGSVAPPAESMGRHHLVVLSRVPDARSRILGLDEAPVLMIGGLAVAAHFLDVDVVAKAVDRLLLFLGRGEVHPRSNHRLPGCLGSVRSAPPIPGRSGRARASRAPGRSRSRWREARP